MRLWLAQGLVRPVLEGGWSSQPLEIEDDAPLLERLVVQVLCVYRVDDVGHSRRRRLASGRGSAERPPPHSGRSGAGCRAS